MSSSQRIYAHYKALKHSSPLEFVRVRSCGLMNACPDKPFFPHSHGYMKTTTSNNVWMTLARTHKMPVRQIKDIVTAERNKRK